jgi:hypothetical protein
MASRAATCIVNVGIGPSQRRIHDAAAPPRTPVAHHQTGTMCISVTGLRADQDAVTAGLTLQWSSGSVEGHVNRTDRALRRTVAVHRWWQQLR